jgi:FlaA1/EpsC-like NDP-sugar epimerase
MGEPVRIVDLARDLVELSGLRRDEIPITFSGLRRGEKLDERLWEEGAIVAPTATADVLRVSESDRSDSLDFEAALQHLDAVARKGSLLEIQHALTQLIPSYAPYPDSSRSPSGEYPGV